MLEAMKSNAAFSPKALLTFMRSSPQRRLVLCFCAPFFFSCLYTGSDSMATHTLDRFTDPLPRLSGLLLSLFLSMLGRKLHLISQISEEPFPSRLAP